MNSTETRRDRKRKIIEIVERRGRCTPHEIGLELDPDWGDESTRIRLQRQLARLVSAQILRRTGYARYAISPGLALGGLDVGDHTANEIEQYLRSRGGIARTREIHEAIGFRAKGGSERGYDHKRITLTLKESPRFEQAFGWGVWNLSPGSMESLPQSGYWAERQMQKAWFNGQRDGFASCADGVAACFERVGLAFLEARAVMDIRKVVADPAIASALETLGRAAPELRERLSAEIRTHVEQNACAAEIASPFLFEQQVQERMATDLKTYLYFAFEGGEPEAHRNMPIEFYWGCAKLFGVCPARLSRGEVIAFA